jgi:hypothetical protein
MKTNDKPKTSHRWQDIRRTLSPEREARIKAKVDEELAKLGLANKKEPTDRS